MMQPREPLLSHLFLISPLLAGRMHKDGFIYSLFGSNYLKTELPVSDFSDLAMIYLVVSVPELMLNDSSGIEGALE